MENQTGQWSKLQTIALVLLVIFTGFYTWCTRDLAKETARLAEMTERQTEYMLGNRPHVELDLVDVDYEYMHTFPPELELLLLVLEPLALTVSITNDGMQSALGVEVYVLGESVQEEDVPFPLVSLYDALSVPPSRSHWYWSEVKRIGELASGDQMKHTLHRKKVEAVFPYIQIEEPDMKYASEVPFAFAVVAICQDDFGRVWLSALELKMECIEGDCELKPGRLRVFQVPSED